MVRQQSHPTTRTRPCPDRLRLSRALAALFVLVALSAAPAGAQPAFQGLGVLPGGTTSGANAVSATGLYIAGHGLNAAHNTEGFRWTTFANPSLAGIGDLPGGVTRSQGWGISADGTAVVGQTDGTNWTAYKWTQAGGMVALGGLVPSVYNSSAAAVSGDGRFVVGWADTWYDAPLHAVRWDTAGVAVTALDLGNLGRPGGADALAVSFDGSVVVGHSDSPLGDQAFRWTGETGMLGLGDLSGGGFSSQALGVSANGSVVVGIGSTTSGVRAFRWTEASGMTAVPASTSGAIPTYAYGISADGTTIVGESTGGAFIWTADDGTRLVADVLAAQGTPATGWTLYSARAVSADGCTIVGRGSSPSREEGWVARLDRDRDGLLDCWEVPTKGIDSDGDGEYDFRPAESPHNADPDHKDIFVEFDAMLGTAPSMAALDAVRDAFAAAPVANPDGHDGITLHSEFDDIAVRPRAEWTDLDARGWPREFDAFKAANFGTATERGDADAGKILAAKRLAYRYGVFAYKFGTVGWSGAGEIGGNDFFVTLGDWSFVPNPEVRNELTEGAYMHELGHTLGLKHGGGQQDDALDDRYNYKPNYYSVMNYTWQFRGLILPPYSIPQFLYRASWRLDYSRAALPAVSEAAFLEAGGFGGSPSVWVPVGPLPVHVVPMGGGADCNGNGAPDPAYAADLNAIRAGLRATPGDTLEGFDDWAHLKFSFRDSTDFADGAHLSADAPNEMTFAQAMALAAAIPSCLADFNGDGAVNSQDLFDFLTAFFALAPTADFNHDNAINSQDFFDFLTAFFSANC